MKKKTAPSKQTRKNILDFSAWNFVIFLTLTFVLIVIVALTMSDEARALRAKAGLQCPEVKTLPRPEDCPGGEWIYQRAATGCVEFVCKATEM